MPNRAWIYLGGLFAILALALILLSSATKRSKKLSQDKFKNTQNNQNQQESVDEEKEGKIKVEAEDYIFSPSEITVQRGEKVEIKIVNNGNTSHEFVIDEFGVASNVLDPGQEDMVSFTPQIAGTYTYYCGRANHRRLGMEGKLIVE